VNQNKDREILLALLRAEPVAAVTPAQWPAIAILARQHMVDPLLYRQLKVLGLTDQIPTEVLQTLRFVYLRTANQNLHIYHVLGGLFERLQDAGIQGILLKGAFLADAVYGNIAVRPMGDADVLIKKTDLAQVGNIMLEMDFRRTDYATEAIKEGHHFGYIQAKSGLIVEIHWNLIDSIYGIHPDLDAIWERSRETRVADIPSRSLSTEDLVLHLCAHNSVHLFNFGLRAICDLAETLRHYHETIDWECLRQDAREWGAERCLYVNLWLAKELLNSPAPDDFLKAIKPADFEPRYLTLAQDYLFTSVEETQDALPSSPNVVRFLTADSLSRKIALLRQRMLPSRQRMAMMYPAPPYSLRIFMYYPVHFKKHSRVVWQLLRGDAQTVAQAERQNQINELKSWLLSG
jgi:hypothetical protein